MVARAGYSRFCYCREGGRTDNEVGRTRRQYGMVLPGSKHYSGKLERLAGCGRRGWLVQGRGRLSGLYALAVPDKWIACMTQQHSHTKAA